ncbi:MAG: DUF4013 domain-containing protein [Methanobrevibacter sp.]|nr:DUF4013 domain-containing protein [Methanobrevibacter sp.]
MDFGKIVSNSFKYPFRNIKKLPILFILFILVSIIPIGIVYDNKYVMAIGVFAFFLFILLVPGYLFSFVKVGLNESSLFPSLSFGNTIYDTLRVLALRIVYMIVPTAVFFIALSTLGTSSPDMLSNLNIPSFLLNVGLIIVVVLVTYILFEILLFFAKARLAYLNSLSEAVKIHKVIGDIRTIGIFNIIKWLIFMAVLVVVASVVSAWVIAIPYVGFLIYIAVVIPLLESIGNYSLGLLYSNIVDNDDDLDRLEREIESLKYLN